MRRPVAPLFPVIALALSMALIDCGGGAGGGNPGIPPVIVTIMQPPMGVVGTAYPNFTFTATGGALPLMWTESGALPPGLALGGGGVLSGTPTSNGSFLITVMVQDRNGEKADPQSFTIQITLAAQPSRFTLTGVMETGRAGHTATLLQNGKVLVAGGADSNNNSLATAELFDPASGTFVATGSMGTARSAHAAILLNSGQVLITGGAASNGDSLATAEVFDPATGMFTPTGSMGAARAKHTATLLESGNVLVTGGIGSQNALATAELFDPLSGNFAPTGNMGSPRARHTATLVLLSGSSANGKVLVTGGIDGNQSALATAELFDPASGTFASAGAMHMMRAGHAAVELNDGRVLITGGDAEASAELFDPVGGTFSNTGSMANERTQHTATLLSDGTVVVTGGGKIVVAAVCGNNCVMEVPLSLATTELFDSGTGEFTLAGDMSITRLAHTATLLKNGKVLVTGGFHTQVLGRQFVSKADSSAELFH